MTTDKEKLLAFADSLEKRSRIISDEVIGQPTFIMHDGSIVGGKQRIETVEYDYEAIKAAAVIQGFLIAYEAIERDYAYSVQQGDENLGLEHALTYIETAMEKLMRLISP